MFIYSWMDKLLCSQIVWFEQAVGELWARVDGILMGWLGLDGKDEVDLRG